MSDAPTEKGESVIRIESNRLVEIGNCSIVVAFFPISGASVGKGESVLRIESNRLIEIRDGSVIVTFFPISEASARKGENACRDRSNGLNETRYPVCLRRGRSWDSVGSPRCNRQSLCPCRPFFHKRHPGW